MIHQLLSQQTGILQQQLPYYKYEPSPILENNLWKIYWDQPIITDRPVQHNRPDIIVINKEKQTCSIIDFSVPLDDNIGKASKEKFSKYQDLQK